MIQAKKETGLDFILNFDTDRDIKVLQITDTQIIDSEQCRFKGRLAPAEEERWAPDQMNVILFSELDQLIQNQSPDLILLTGDMIYGEFDDKGTSFDKIIEIMDSYQIPWAPVFGNHDNESAIGVDEQCRRLEKQSTKCLFKRRDEIGGNGNYSIGIAQRGEIKRIIFMLDSRDSKLRDTQMEWYQSVVAKVSDHAKRSIPSFLCFHIPPKEMGEALIDKGYLSALEVRDQPYAKFDLGMDATQEDFGFKFEGVREDNQLSTAILPRLQASGADGVFFGHHHDASLSILWKGIRWTFGLKTGQYDYHPELRGGTMITLNGFEFGVKHVLFDDQGGVNKQ